ncbi:MAG: YaeQ family protein [Candidatus Pelagadaptatus aseana]|uniref:YaeQ family protein n=1 Tax=Candidatus Pelagadaptatus aseana TaxID=3120508 RepID=UPI0039B1FD89
MALKPTIFKFKIALSDLDRHVYDTLDLTVAQHPSENTERMMARVLAYCLNCTEGLAFTKGLSTPDEPDVWCKSLDDQLLLWLDVGEPSADRIKKATRLSDQVKVYSFNAKTDVWWGQESGAFSGLATEVWKFPWETIQQLAEMVERTMDFSVTVSASSLYVATASGDCEIACLPLQLLD